MLGGGNLLSSYSKGFTLAEILITLGIIGVVAAMTMPVLITNHKKNVTLTRLKRSYNILSNVFVRAQVDYGDIINWDLSNNRGVEHEAESSRKILDTFIKKFVLPYLADGYTYNDNMTLSDLGYKTKILYRNGSTLFGLTNQRQSIRLQDGTYIFIYNTVTQIPNDSGEIKQYLSGILFVIDIDGPKGNNIIGKDVFLGGIYFVNNAKFIFYQNGKTNNNNFIPQEYTREELVQGCETDGRFCGTLIQSDGWQIKYKY